MSYFSAIEPSVIDDELLKKAIQQQQQEYEASPNQLPGEIIKRDAVDPNEVLELRLDFKSNLTVFILDILKIDNLIAFENLTKLQLDNNIIEKIENLGSLKNLTNLNLSFNNISQIEGLNELKNLTDLSLFHNQIKKLENLDSLTKLVALSIGENQIQSQNDLLYLSKFENLRILNVAGNPFTQDTNYKHFVVAFLKQLKYLDYRLISEEQVKQAKIQFEEQLKDLDKKEIEEKKQLILKEQQSKEKKLYKELYLDDIDVLYHEIFANDQDLAKFMPIAQTEINSLIEEHQAKASIIVNELKDFAMKQKGQREEEESQFITFYQEAKKEVDQEGIRMIRTTQKEIKVLLSNNEKTMENCQEKIQNLFYDLMKNEIQLSEQIEDVLKEFEQNYSQLCSVSIEGARQHFTKLRDLENEMYEKISEAALRNFDNLAKTDTEDMNEQIRDLLSDKDAFLNLLTASHEFRISKIEHQEEVFVAGMNGHLEKTLSNFQHTELLRNRDRVVEIKKLTDIRLSDMVKRKLGVEVKNNLLVN